MVSYRPVTSRLLSSELSYILAFSIFPDGFENCLASVLTLSPSGGHPNGLAQVAKVSNAPIALVCEPEFPARIEQRPQ